MSVGFYNVNDSGSVIIDENYMNLEYKTKWSVSSITANAYYQAAGYEYPADSNLIYWIVDFLDSNNAMIAVAPPIGRNIGTQDITALSIYTYPLQSGYRRLVFFSEGTTPATLTCYLFDNLSSLNLINTGYGLQILNSSGTLVYHSSRKYLRIDNGLVLRGSLVGTNYTVSSSKSYAFLLSNPGRRRYLPASTSLRRYKQACFKQTSTTNIQCYGSNYWFKDNLPSGALVDNEPDLGFIVDVTGY